jgi:hypothetical protein
MPATISVNKQPVNGRQTVTTSAKRLTQIVQSIGATTFTKSTVVDAGGWSLTNVQAGNIIQVIQADGDEYRGIVQSKDAGTSTITVQGWKRGGVSGRARAEMKPTDGRAAYVLKVDRCKKLLVDALDANSADIYLGFDENVTISGANAGHPIAAIATQPNHRLPVEADLQEYIDLANVFVIAGSSQGLSYIAM